MRIESSFLQQGSDVEHTSAEDDNPEVESSDAFCSDDPSADADLDVEGQEDEEPDEMKEMKTGEGGGAEEDLFGAASFFDDPKTPQVEEPETEIRQINRYTFQDGKTDRNRRDTKKSRERRARERERNTKGDPGPRSPSNA